MSPWKRLPFHLLTHDTQIHPRATPNTAPSPVCVGSLGGDSNSWRTQNGIRQEAALPSKRAGGTVYTL